RYDHVGGLSAEWVLRMSSPVAWRTIMAGMWGRGSAPLWAFVIGGPSTLLTTSTPMAPACSALRTFSVDSHVPRSADAIFPVTAVVSGWRAADGAGRARPPCVGGSSELHSLPASSYSPLIDSGSSIVIAMTSAPPSREAATEMTPSATAGDPVT